MNSLRSLTNYIIGREQKLKQKLDTPFSDENMFNQLNIEGSDDVDSVSSSDSDGGGVSLNIDGPTPEHCLMDSDMDDKWKVASPKQPILRPLSVKPASVPKKNGPEAIPGGLSRFWHAAQLNKHPLPKRPSGKAEEQKNSKKAKEAQWIPDSKSDFWRTYANRLRVYATETEVCSLGD
jgi:hypothetical protein